MRKISYLKQKLILTFGYLLVLAIFYLLDIPCLSVYLLKLPCPGCGMTRALRAALQFDFSKAFSYNPMFWSLPILYLYFLLDKGLFPQKWANSLLLHGIGIGFLVQWVFKIVEF